jgi:hypothetical protein
VRGPRQPLDPPHGALRQLLEPPDNAPREHSHETSANDTSAEIHKDVP